MLCTFISSLSLHEVCGIISYDPQPEGIFLEMIVVISNLTYAYRLSLHRPALPHLERDGELLLDPLSTSYSHGYGDFVGLKIIANTLGVKRVFWKKVHAFVSEHERESEHNRWYNLSSNPTCSGRCILFVNVSQVINATPLHKHASPLFFPLSPMPWKCCISSIQHPSHSLASCKLSQRFFHFLCPLPLIYDWIWSSTARRLAWNHFTDWIRLAHI